jgi:hypothetical protein
MSLGPKYKEIKSAVSVLTMARNVKYEKTLKAE